MQMDVNLEGKMQEEKGGKEKLDRKVGETVEATIKQKNCFTENSWKEKINKENGLDRRNYSSKLTTIQFVKMMGYWIV